MPYYFNIFHRICGVLHSPKNEATCGFQAHWHVGILVTIGHNQNSGSPKVLHHIEFSDSCGHHKLSDGIVRTGPKYEGSLMLHELGAGAAGAVFLRTAKIWSADMHTIFQFRSNQC